MSKERKLKFGALIHGVGGNITGWRHPDVQTDASVSFDFYKRQAQKAEEETTSSFFCAGRYRVRNN